MDPLLVVLLKLAGKEALTHVWKRLVQEKRVPPLEAAIERTASEFKYAALSPTLRDWYDSDAVKGCLDRFGQGHDPSEQDRTIMIDAFLATRFEPNEAEVASRILAFFVEALHEALLASDRGQVYQTQFLSRTVQDSGKRTVTELTSTIQSSNRDQTEVIVAAVKDLLTTVAAPAGADEFALVRTLMSEGRAATAEVVLISMAESNSAHDSRYEWHALAGLCALRIGKRDDAIQRLMRALDLNSARAPANSNVAQALLARGDGARALEYAERALAIDPNDQLGLLVKAQVRGDDNIEEGLQYAARLSDNGQRHYIEGAIYKRAGRLREAIGAMEASLAAGFSQADVYFWLAESKLAAANAAASGTAPGVWQLQESPIGAALNEAQELLTRGLEVPGGFERTIDRGRLLALRGYVRAFLGHEEARADTRNAQEFVRDDLSIALTVARAFLALADPDKAIEALRDRVSAHGQEAEVVTLLLTTLVQLDRLAEATTLLESIRPKELIPDELRLSTEALLAADAGDQGAATRLLARIPETDWSVDTVIIAARTALRFKDYASATDVLNRNLDRVDAGQRWKLGLWLARAHMAAGRTSDAVAALEALKGPDSPEEFMAMYVDALVQNDQIGTALGVIDEYIPRRPPRNELLLRKARLLAELGSVTEAIAIYEQLR